MIVSHLFNIHFTFLVISIFGIGLTYPFKEFRLPEKVINWSLRISGILSILLSFLGIIQITGQSDHFYLSIIKLSQSKENSVIYLFMSTLLAATAHFSFKYIHKEDGYHKFFLNFLIFWVGLILFNFSGDNLVTFAGWELIGISSIFLISYYHKRRGPIVSSLYVVSFYKVADILLITGLLFLKHEHQIHHSADSDKFLYLMIIIAALIKSASFPFTSWLPRAMEGPTPSSAVYYAALSVNTGVLLIVKFLPEILSFELTKNFLLIAGIATVVYSSIQSRVQNDVKASLAYSTSTQIGIVLVELSMGWKYLALFHLFSSSILKIYQFIRTPSLLHIYHSIEGDFGKPFGTNGIHFQYLLPKSIRKKLYYISINHFYIDNFYQSLKWFLIKIGSLSKDILYPLIGNKTEPRYRTLLWGGYYIFVILLVNLGAIEISNIYFTIIPITIFFISTTMLFEKNLNSFIALFGLYKIAEGMLVHSVHTHEPYKWLSVLLAGVFSISLMVICKRQQENIRGNLFFSSLTIFMMLFFTNFPFLLQSLVNEHIIEALIEQGSILNLLMYSTANTFLNLGLYHFVFGKVYLTEATNG